MPISKHKKLVNRLKKSGKLSVYTKSGTAIPLNVVGRKSLQKKKLYPKKKESLCAWLNKKHSSKRRRHKKKTRLRGGGDANQNENQNQNQDQQKNVSTSPEKKKKLKISEDNMLSKLERKIVDKLNSMGLDTRSLN